jgi:hypothetical protein
VIPGTGHPGGTGVGAKKFSERFDTGTSAHTAAKKTGFSPDFAGPNFWR